MYFGFVLAWVILFGKINRGATLKLPGVTCFSAGRDRLMVFGMKFFTR